MTSSSIASPSLGRRFFERFIQAHPSIASPVERRQAELISALAFTISIITIFGAVITILNTGVRLALIPLAFFGIVTVVVYFLSRTERYLFSGTFFVVSLNILAYFLGASAIYVSLAFELVIAISFILSSLLKLKWMFWLWLANLFAVFLITPFLFPQVQGQEAFIMRVGVLTIGIFLLLFSWHRQSLENLRLTELEQVAQNLRDANLKLDQNRIVLERQFAILQLVTDVSRSISQVRALKEMLTDAVNIIQKQFNLYYVQVYLVNAAKSELVLQAGTGDVGQKLLERSHHLPIKPDSINGRAALEQRIIVVADTTQNTMFRPNPLLPLTRSEMAIPLLLGQQIVGVLDLQSDRPNELTEETIPAFESLAGQLAIAIINAQLLQEAQQARQEIEKQARRSVRSNWANYLDAVYKPKQIGFVYQQNQIIPLSDDILEQQTSAKNTLTIPMQIIGEPIGEICISLPDEAQSQALQQQAHEIVEAIAGRVAQHIESLRLVDTAERYRLQAEQAARRMTMEGWQAYVAQQSGALSYFYDRSQVTPIAHLAIPEADALTVSLKLREESVGLISIFQTPQASSEDIEFVQEFATRLSAHIENLRLLEQTQFALSQTERLSNASLRLAQSTKPQELLQIAVETLAIADINRALLETCNFDTDGQLKSMTVLANWWLGSGQQPSPVGTTFQIATVPALKMFVGTTPIFIEDTATEIRLDSETRAFLQQHNIRAIAALPLEVGNRQIGVLFLEFETPHHFSKDEIRLFVAMGPQIATVLENRRQFERAQQQAEREALLNTISQKIQSATSVEAVLQIAAREIGHALGAPRTIAQLSVKDRKT